MRLSKITVLLFASLHPLVALRLVHYDNHRMGAFDARKQIMTTNFDKEHSGVDPGLRASEPLVFDYLSNNSTIHPIQLEKVGLRRAKRNTSKRPAIGLCVAGLSRTFPDDLVHERYKDLIISPLRDYGDLSLFFLFGVWDDVRRNNTINENEYSILTEVVSEFNPAAALLLEEGDSFRVNKNCKMPRGWESTSSRLRRWYFQWVKVKACYGLMERYERESGSTFDFMVRIRPDLLFLQPLTPSLMFQQKKITVPEGIIGHGPGGINDHIAACPRALCSSYFDIVGTYDNCAGLWESYMGHSAGGNDDGAVLLGNHLSSLGITVEEVRIDYTIYRGCPEGPECQRLPVYARPACRKINYSCPK